MFASNTNLNQRKWLDTPVNNQGKIKRTKTSARLKWPIFGEMEEKEFDPFWKNYWLRASKGKFPLGFSFNGKELFYSYRNKISKIVFTDNIEDLCQLTKHIYQEKSNIYSPTDMKHNNQRREILYGDPEDEGVSWTKCSNAQKSSLVTFYLLELVNEYNLTGKEKYELQQTISIGINIGAFNDKKIQMEDNKITSIIGLEWDSEKEKFFLNPKNAPYKIKKPSKGVSRKNDTHCLYSYWLKLNSSKNTNKDRVTEIGLEDVCTSLSSSHYKEDE